MKIETHKVVKKKCILKDRYEIRQNFRMVSRIETTEILALYNLKNCEWRKFTILNSILVVLSRKLETNVPSEMKKTFIQFIRFLLGICYFLHLILSQRSKNRTAWKF